MPPMRTSCTLPIVLLEILRNRVWGVLDNPARLGCLRIGVALVRSRKLVSPGVVGGVDLWGPISRGASWY